MLILLLTGRSCFTVSPHSYFVRSCMPVHVQICVCAFVEYILFYVSSGQVFLSFHHHYSYVMLRPQWDSWDILVDGFSNVTTCSDFCYETI